MNLRQTFGRLIFPNKKRPSFDVKTQDEIINYCLKHSHQMWAAITLGIIFKCDFRDAPLIAHQWQVGGK